MREKKAQNWRTGLSALLNRMTNGMTAEDGFDALNAWLAKAGLRGEPEAALVSGFCERAVAADLPISRAQMFIDTLHPVYDLSARTLYLFCSR
jgi:hypothetical protein